MVVTSAGPALLTVGDMARELGVERDRVIYIIRSRQLTPAGRAGNCRLFTEVTFDRVRREIESIDAAREALAS